MLLEIVFIIVRKIKNKINTTINQGVKIKRIFFKADAKVNPF